MNIDRDNYEEYFLLYADDELTDSEKTEVLIFVKNNKDLEEEFRMIHHTILKPDATVKFNNKSLLFKNESSFINEKNYEAVFILYHDNELSANERLQTEEFLSLHNELNNEFDLIGLAKLTAENNVVFTDKKILYKKEKPEKIASLMMWRMLAAAVFIGFVLWIINYYIRKPAALNQPIAHNIPLKKFTPLRTIILQKKDTNELVVHNADDTNSSIKKKDDVITSQKILQQKNNSSLAKMNFNKEKTLAKDANKQLPEKGNAEEVAFDKTTKNISEAEITASQNIEPAKLLVLDTAIKNAAEVLPVTTAKVSYIENLQAKNDNYIFYDIAADKFKKTKAGSFFKKMKRVIVRTNPIGRLLSGEERQVATK